MTPATVISGHGTVNAAISTAGKTASGVSQTLATFASQREALAHLAGYP